MTRVCIDAAGIADWRSFHSLFARAFGFPDFYGRNMDAWVDCMTSLDQDDGMTTVQVAAGDVVVLELDHVDAFAERCPEIYLALIECVAFVNFRRLEVGEPAVLVLSFHRRSTG